MFIVEVHHMRDEETVNNLQANSQPVYDATVTYKYGDEVVYGDYVYYSINRDNTGNQPDTSPLYWVIKEEINKLRFYDKYPNSLAINNGDDITLQYNVTDVDAIYLGNIHGESVTVTAGATFTKVIPPKSHSPIDAWGVNTYSQMGDFYVPLGALYTGVVDVTITKSTVTNDSALGFINYGNLRNAGCTLLDSIKYNIRSAGGIDWAKIDLDTFRARTYTEMKLPIRIDEKTVFTRDVVDVLSEYRGVPVLIIGDDEGKREETIFFGVYTDLEAKISDKNSYVIVLRSLSYKAFIAPTEREQSLLDAKKAIEEDEANNPPSSGATPTNTCCDRVYLKAFIQFEGTGYSGHSERITSFLLNQDTDNKPRLYVDLFGYRDVPSLRPRFSSVGSDLVIESIVLVYIKDGEASTYRESLTQLDGRTIPDGGLLQGYLSGGTWGTDIAWVQLEITFESLATNNPTYAF